MKFEEQFGQLVDMLRVVAADAEAQIAVHPTFVVVADEIALNYDDALQVALGHGLADVVGAELCEAMVAIERTFASFSGPGQPHLWSLDGLRTAPIWERQRHAARDVLARLRIEASPLRLNGITYVRCDPPPPTDPDSDVTFRKEPDAR